MAYRSLLAASAALVLAACATPSMQAQWTSPQLAAGQLRSASVWVECSAREPTLARICEDQLSSRLAATGIKVMRAAPSTTPVPALSAARNAGAGYVLSLALEADTAPQSSGPSLGIGIGGGSWGSRVGGGVSTGISLPLAGGGSVETLAGQAALQKVSGGEMLWSGTARSGGGSVPEQIDGLARTTVEALGKAGAL